MLNHRQHFDDLRSLRIAIAATLAIVVIQVAGSILSSSLALLSDSAHMAVDLFSLFIAYISLHIAQRRSHQHMYTFGWRRIEILAALLNGLVLFILCGVIAWEAIERLVNPRPVLTVPMLIAASIGLIGNGIAWHALRHSSHLTTRSAYFHVLNDMLSSVTVIVGGLMMGLTGLHVVDPLLSLAIVLFIVRSALGIIRRALAILMERVPDHLQLHCIEHALNQHPSVRDVHDLHLWQIGANSHAMSAHVVVATTDDRDRTLADLQSMLNRRFGIRHATLQLEGQPYTEHMNCQGCEHSDPFSHPNQC